MRIKISNLDKLASLYIRTRDNWTCQRCLKQYQPPTMALHCSHFYGRSNKKVRFDEDNLQSFCYGCHSYMDSHPVEFTEWKKKQLGEEAYEKLNQRANWRSYEKVDLKLVEMYLKQKLSELAS